MRLRKKIVVLGVLASSVAGFSNAFGGGFVSEAPITAITAQDYGGTGQFSFSPRIHAFAPDERKLPFVSIK
jgi:hypothetical protein